MVFVTREISSQSIPPAAYDRPADTVLQGINAYSMVNILKQISELSKFTNEIFTNLYQETTTTGNRIKSLTTRMKTLECTIPQFEQTFNNNASNVYYCQSAVKTYQRNEPNRQTLFNTDSLPQEVQRIRSLASAPPNVSLLDNFANKSCLKLYSDPNFFFNQWAIVEAEKQKKAIEDRKEKRKKKKLLRDGTSNKQPKQVEAVKVKQYSAQGHEFQNQQNVNSNIQKVAMVSSQANSRRTSQDISNTHITNSKSATPPRLVTPGTITPPDRDIPQPPVRSPQQQKQYEANQQSNTAAYVSDAASSAPTHAFAVSNDSASASPSLPPAPIPREEPPQFVPSNHRRAPSIPPPLPPSMLHQTPVAAVVHSSPPTSAIPSPIHTSPVSASPLESPPAPPPFSPVPTTKSYSSAPAPPPMDFSATSSVTIAQYAPTPPPMSYESSPPLPPSLPSYPPISPPITSLAIGGAPPIPLTPPIAKLPSSAASSPPLPISLPATDERGGLLAEIRRGRELRKIDTTAASLPAETESGRGGLLSEIRNRNFQLKSVKKEDSIEKKTTTSNGGLQSIMDILARRQAIGGDSDAESSADEWD